MPRSDTERHRSAAESGTPTGTVPWGEPTWSIWPTWGSGGII